MHDPALDEEPQLLRAVGAAAGSRWRTGVCTSELKAKLQELEGSRGRVLEAGQQERKRLERNLHDGAQQRLIALSLELGRFSAKLDDDAEARARIQSARAEIATSLEELRTVARGLHPAVLSGHGLGVALESLAAGSPVPVRLNVGVENRLDESIEVAAYYVVAESLANIGKHARPRWRPSTSTAQGDEIVVEVVDDGIGGADSDRGSGLAVSPTESRRSEDGSGYGRPAAEALEYGRSCRARSTGRGQRSPARRTGAAADGRGLRRRRPCDDAEELMRKLSAHAVDVAILDIRLPPTHTDEGLRAALEIRERYPGTGVLVLSQYIELGLAMKLLSGSAEGTGYLLKDRIGDVKDFVAAVDGSPAAARRSTR